MIVNLCLHLALPPTEVPKHLPTRQGDMQLPEEAFEDHTAVPDPPL